MKKFLLCTLILGLFAFTGSPALAEATNTNTGEDSTNVAVDVAVDFVFVGNFNYDSDINNFAMALANTGFNNISDEDCNTIGTGSASAGGAVANFQNTNLTMVDAIESGATASNSDTGEKSENWAVAVDLSGVAVLNFNDADLNNFTIALANTGFNSINGDDSNSITTGNALSGAMTANVQNTNYTSINGVGGSSANVSNSNTGEKSFNVAGALDVDLALVVNLNDAYANNLTLAVANTGGNRIKGADDDNSISTGTATAGAASSNVQNTNITQITGDSTGSTSASNTGAYDAVVDCGTGCPDEGEKSENWAVAVDIDADVVVNSNDADLNNATVAVSNTGANSVSGDDDNNSITTGSATSGVMTSNTQNTNITSIGGTGCFPDMCR